VVIQNEDGTLEAVTPEEAKKRMAAMPPERRALYEPESEWEVAPAPDAHEQMIKDNFHHKL
jgi:hypothetical protein